MIEKSNKRKELMIERDDDMRDMMIECDNEETLNMVLGEFSFLGALIVEEVINDLINRQGMNTVTKLLLA